MRLILTRHGQTVENKNGIIQGHLPGKLSEEGIQQAKKLALRLKDENIDCIYSSDLKRAADTAKEIAKYHPNTPFHKVEELRERDHGGATGKTKDEVDWSNFWNDGETMENMAKRAKKLIDEAYGQYKDGTVVFIGHGAINMVLLSVILKTPPEKIDRIARQRNASVSIFKFREDRNHEIHLLDCVKHLE